MREFPNASQQSRTLLDFDCLPLWAHASTLILLHLSRVRVGFNTVAYNGKRQIGLHIPIVEVRSTKSFWNSAARRSVATDLMSITHEGTWKRLAGRSRPIRHDSIKTLEWCRTFLSLAFLQLRSRSKFKCLWKMRVSTLTARRFTFMTDCFRDIDSTARMIAPADWGVEW